MTNQTEDQHAELSATPVDFDPFAGPAIDYTIPATSAQEEIYLACELDAAASSAFNLVTRIVISGNVDFNAMSQAVAWIGQRHDALRATFSRDGRTMIFSDNAPVSLVLESGTMDTVAAAEREETERLFNLQSGPLFTCRFFELEDAGVVLLNTHHIVVDGWSADVIMQDLSFAYGCFERGETPARDQPTQFSEFAKEWQGDTLLEDVAADTRYWTGIFQDAPEPLELPALQPRPKVFTGRANHQSVVIPREMMNRLETIGRQSKCTLITTMVGTLSAYIARVTGQNDLVIGIPAAAQAMLGKPDMVGHCTNVLPMRIQMDPTQTFTQHLARVREAFLSGFEHATVSFGQLIRHIQIERDVSRPTLVPVILNIDSISTLNFGEFSASVEPAPRVSEQFELFINCVDDSDGLEMDWSYAADLFTDKEIGRRIDEFLTLLDELTEHPDRTIECASVVPAQQRELLLNQWNSTQTETSPLDVLSAFKSNVEHRANIAAVQFADRSLTYGALDKASTAIAGQILEQTQSKPAVVGLAIARTELTLAAILGVWKAGCAYLPLDPEFPAARLEHMVQDSGTGLIITNNINTDFMPGFAGPRLTLETIAQASENTSVSLNSQTTKECLAYLIYTSGSTGVPKGVRVNHGQLENFLASMSHRPGLTTEDKLLAVTTLSFDISILELLLPVYVGACVRLVDSQVSADPSALEKELSDSCSTVMQATPSTWRMLAENGWQGDLNLKVLCGGEALPEDLAIDLAGRSGELWNMYGPTETTIWSTCHRVSSEDSQVLIGTPIANTSVYLLDANQMPVPIGVPGELYIAGAGVADGYHERPDLTAERFPLDPFAGDGARMYRTGDLVRWTESGILDYLRRVDTQVKLRGFRIELGEIENAIADVPSVNQCAVAVVEISELDRRLCAYYTSDSAIELEAEIRESLSARLPYYMIPQHISQLDQLPLTANGKVDRKRLPTDLLAHSESDQAPPAGEAEEFVAQIWGEVLGQPVSSRLANFFHIGGHSLLAMQVCARVRDAVGLDLPLRYIFEHPELSAFADMVEARLADTLEV